MRERFMINFFPFSSRIQTDHVRYDFHQIVLFINHNCYYCEQIKASFQKLRGNCNSACIQYIPIQSRAQCTTAAQIFYLLKHKTLIIQVITGNRGSFSYLIDPGEVVAQVGLFQRSIVGAPSSTGYWASLRLRLQRSGMDSKLFLIFCS